MSPATTTILKASPHSETLNSDRNYPITWINKAALRMAALSLPFILLSTCVVPLHAQERQSLSRVAPVYPELAKRMHITGTIRVVATVDANGAVLNAESESGNKMLAPAAVDAVKRWKFAPGEGHSTVTVQVVFEL